MSSASTVRVDGVADVIGRRVPAELERERDLPLHQLPADEEARLLHVAALVHGLDLDLDRVRRVDRGALTRPQPRDRRSGHGPRVVGSRCAIAALDDLVADRCRGDLLQAEAQRDRVPRGDDRATEGVRHGRRSPRRRAPGGTAAGSSAPRSAAAWSGTLSRGSGAPVSASCVGSSVAPEPAVVSSANGCMPASTPPVLGITTLDTRFVEPTPSQRVPVPSHHWS